MMLICRTVEPSQPGEISVTDGGRQTNSLRISWNQTGNAEHFNVNVTNESYASVNYSSVGSTYYATLSNLSAAGKLYNIEVSAVSDSKQGGIQTTAERTCKSRSYACLMFVCSVTGCLLLCTCCCKL